MGRVETFWFEVIMFFLLFILEISLNSLKQNLSIQYTYKPPNGRSSICEDVNVEQINRSLYPETLPPSPKSNRNITVQNYFLAIEVYSNNTRTRCYKLLCVSLYTFLAIAMITVSIFIILSFSPKFFQA